MTVTVKGFQGTISDADMATQFGGHHGPTVRSSADLLVTAVGGARQVSVAAGVSDHAFVKYASDAAQVLTLAPPASGGKWYLIAINRQWSPTNTAVLEAVDIGVTNDGSVPNSPAAAVYTGAFGVLRKNPGTAGSTSAYGAHAALALVHVRAADTTLTIFDVRAISTAAGNISVATFHGLKWASAVGSVQEGGIVTVRQHQEPGMNGGKHLASTWERLSSTYGVFTPVGPIFVDESAVPADINDKLQVSKGAHAWLLNLATDGAGAIGFFILGATAVDSGGGKVWKFVTEGNYPHWVIWETQGNIESAMFQRPNDVGYDNGTTTLAVRGGVAFFSFSLYTGNARGNNGIFGQFFPGVRPFEGDHHITGPAYDGGDFLTLMSVSTDGYLRCKAPRTNGGAGWNAIRGNASWRVA